MNKVFFAVFFTLLGHPNSPKFHFFSHQFSGFCSSAPRRPINIEAEEEERAAAGPRARKSLLELALELKEEVCEGE